MVYGMLIVTCGVYLWSSVYVLSDVYNHSTVVCVYRLLCVMGVSNASIVPVCGGLCSM